MKNRKDLVVRARKGYYAPGAGPRANLYEKTSILPLLERSRGRKRTKPGIALTLGQIEKQFGKGSIVRLGSKEAIVPVAVISSGSIRSTSRWARAASRVAASADLRAGIVGQNHVALQVIAEAQKTGGMAAFIDVEHALDPIYAKKLA